MARFLTVIVLALTPASLFAGKIKTVTIATPAHYEKAQFQQTVVSSEGRISLARMLKPLALKAPLDAARVWDVAEDKAGNLYVATGDDGKIFKITADGQVALAFDSEDSQILCLRATADGSIYAGTGPSGLIIRIDPAGQAKVLHDSPESYIWGLVADEKDGNLYAATGPHGRILRIAADGKAQVFFQCKQDHILSMVRTADGVLYAGTDKQGVVYRVDAKGKGYVLFQAPQAEIRCLQLIGDTLYAGTSSPSGGRSAGPSGGSSTGGNSISGMARSEPGRASDDSRTRLAPNSSTPGRERDSEKFSAAAAPSSVSGGENSVYRIGNDGAAREVFREKGLVLSLHKVGEKILVGTGSKGQLFEVHEATRERSEIARLESGQVQRLYQRRDGSVLIATGDPGRLYVLQDRHAASGSVIGEVIDAKLTARWGTMNWHADVPTGTKLTIAVRGGNVADPDETWSDWSAEQLDPRNATALIPAARYAQFRVTMATSDTSASPTLHHLVLRYSTLNQAPELTSLDVPTTEAIAASKDPKKIKIKWTATDANEDELSFDLFVRKEGWKEWVRIEEGFAKTEYEWDTTTMPSGAYQVRVVASDRPDNNEADTLIGERVSLPLVIAHEPPAVTLKVVGIDRNRAIFEATASSSLVRLTSASYALSGGKWSNLHPSDNLFDSRDERFRFSSDTLQPGTHVMVLRVRDGAGNIGSADVVFEVKRADK